MPPVYEYECEKGHKFDRYLKLKYYKEPQVCECGAKTRKLMSTPMIAPTFEAYESPIDGKPITSKKKRAEDLAKSGCVPYEMGLKEENNKKLRDGELLLEKNMENTVDHEISKMSARKQELLEQNINAGATIEVGR